MSQAISGVSPSTLSEVTVMTVWPSIGGTPMGQTLGRLFQIRLGFPPIFTLGHLIALASIPLAIPLYFSRLLYRYRLTNRRVLVERGPGAKVVRSVNLDEFDTIDVSVFPGQEWYPCGELVFRKGKLETLRLSGVQRPETFKQTCLKAQRAYVFVARDVAAQE